MNAETLAPLFAPLTSLRGIGPAVAALIVAISLSLLLRQEADFAEIAWTCALMLSPTESSLRLREELALRLEQWEREVYGWTVAA